jgi:PKD repeat protein
VQFTDQSTAGDNSIISWSWEFGDGDTSTDQNPTHTYDTPGAYNVTLTVTDSHGCSDTKTTTVTVYAKPTATASSNSPVSQGATIQLYGEPNGMAEYHWTGPGGWTSDLQNPTRPNATKAMEGTYTLTVTNSNGCSDDATTDVVVTVPVTPTGGGVSCPSTKYLTVDWEGNNTTKPLYSNNCLAVNLTGPSPDLSHNLFLERGTHAPVVGEKTYYLIVVRELEEIPPPPENTVALVVFNITPADAEFNRDIFLTLGLNQTQLPANTLNVTMAYYDDVKGAWEKLEYEAGGPNGVAELTLSAPINHFSIYGVLAELAPTPQPAHFAPSGLSIVPSVEKIWEHITFLTKTGESVNITFNLANDGGQVGDYPVVLKLDGETVDTRTVTLGAGQSQQVEFTQSGLGYGQHKVEVAGLSKTFTTSRTITWWLIIGIIVAIGLIIWGVVWGRRRRRKSHQEA